MTSHLLTGSLARVIGSKIPMTIVGAYRSKVLGPCVELRDRHKTCVYRVDDVGPLCSDCTTKFDTRAHIPPTCETCDALRDRVSA